MIQMGFKFSKIPWTRTTTKTSKEKARTFTECSNFKLKSCFRSKAHYRRKKDCSSFQFLHFSTHMTIAWPFIFEQVI